MSIVALPISKRIRYESHETEHFKILVFPYTSFYVEGKLAPSHALLVCAWEDQSKNSTICAIKCQVCCMANTVVIWQIYSTVILIMVCINNRILVRLYGFLSLLKWTYKEVNKNILARLKHIWLASC